MAMFAAQIVTAAGVTIANVNAWVDVPSGPAAPKTWNARCELPAGSVIERGPTSHRLRLTDGRTGTFAVTHIDESRVDCVVIQAQGTTPLQ